MGNTFDPEQYWKQRITAHADLQTVGHRSFGLAYNRYIYRRRSAVLDGLIRELNMDPKTAHVLDVGCGTGFYTDYWHRHGVLHYVGVDISTESIERLSRIYPSYHFVNADITSNSDLFECPGQHDVVTMFDVLYHIIDDNAAINALRTISTDLAPEGVVLMFDQLADKDYSLTKHVKFRGRENFNAMLKEAGLEIVRAKPLFLLLVPPIFGRRVIDVAVVGAYKAIGWLTRHFEPAGKVLGWLLSGFDRLLLRFGFHLPNHEVFVLTHADRGLSR